MPTSAQNMRTRSLRKKVLKTLADLYLYPQSGGALASALRSRHPYIDRQKVRDCFSYLEKKGYVSVSRARDGKVKAIITSKGIDLADGAVQDSGVLPARPNFTSLMTRKEIRKSVLSFLRQFPDSFNGDDEILAELKELGLVDLIMDQVRFHIWYLSGKKLLEMKTSSLRDELVYYARITARGMDLLDGGLVDPGVNCDE
ncbi:hypothetical protein MNBD_NITROSPINAE02-500 [hydrothermal vent metagenome]|uniref:Uncharacterized protein n=1 Tax=hydrothermal vent metagenome TaxID=652676 RepID=A0A3B1BS06_9ZZZZ